MTCDLVEQAQNKGISPERIAILYPARGRLLDEVRSELTRRQLDFRHEGDDKLPVGSLSRFVQRCASDRDGAAALPRRTGLTRRPPPSPVRRSGLRLR
ncbi:hypothetical protein ACIPJN_21950 [Streptomyces sp. NPDC086796]|uniref:hypothetical protein n=1 Tax=unclassified Streptomyces TaxID=2593676 RepID=UPI00380C0262